MNVQLQREMNSKFIFREKKQNYIIARAGFIICKQFFSQSIKALRGSEYITEKRLFFSQKK
jgi:hypothetical protein